MYRKTSRLLMAAVLTVASSGCGPSVHSSLPPGTALPMSLAVLPPDYSVEIPRERIDLVHDAVLNELRNRNFVIVEDRVVRSLCSSPECPERQKLAQDYLVDGFVSVQLSSFSKNNFIAGYYNQLQGSLLVQDTAGKDLVSVSHTENESGGILLQSGQVFQGLISQVEHSGDSVFDNLADRFAQEVVEQLPAPTISSKKIQPEGVEIALMSVSAQWKTPSTYIVCARGTPHSFAYLLIGKTRTSLLETTPGTYCGSFSALVTSPTSGIEAVELRTAFGNSVRQSVDIPADPPCNMTNRVAATAPQHVALLCTDVTGSGPSKSEGCSQNIPPCSTEKVVLYEAPSAAGPFKKISEQKSTSVTIPDSSATVALITVGRGGVPSQPITLSKE